jgi:hypothetical protein
MLIETLLIILNHPLTWYAVTLAGAVALIRALAKLAAAIRGYRFDIYADDEEHATKLLQELHKQTNSSPQTRLRR